MDATHHMVLGLLFAVVGCCVGSFLSVCAYRVPRGLSLLRPRSRCPVCLTAIRAYDNVPVVSWLILRGECRHCGRAISPRYLIIELAMGLSFVGAYLAEVALTTGDLWERAGVVFVAIQLLVLWAAISILVAAALVFREIRASGA
jgi:leader peptidase (prepilin peptidase)/N-methyltransferase